MAKSCRGDGRTSTHAHRSTRERVCAALTAVALVLSQALAYVGVAPESALADWVPQTIYIGKVSEYPTGQMDGDHHNSHMFGDADGNAMYCADSALGTPDSGVPFDVREKGGLVLDYILWYGHGGSGDQGWTQAETQCAVWWAMYDQGRGHQNIAFSYKQSASQGKLLWQQAVANASVDGPYANSTWLYGPRDGADVQDVIGQTVRTGSLRLHKSSGDAAVTGINSCYSLAGATYEVYDSNMGHVGTLTTGEDGWTNTLDNLSAGTYYVWERSASKGYGTCDGSDGATWIDGYWYHQVNVSVGSTAEVSCSEPPLDDPISFIVQKIDSDGDPVSDADGQGDATTEGTQLTVKFYEGMYDSVDSLPSSADRTWVIQTKNANGKIRARLSDDFKVSGDDWYSTTPEGNANLPLGTFTVQETKAPEGYDVSDSSAHLGQVIIDSDSATGVSIKKIGDWSFKFDQEDAGAGLAVVDQVKRGGVRLSKVDHERDDSIAQGDATLAGAEVSIYNRSEKAVYVDGRRIEPGDVALTLVTGLDGTAQSATDALPYGTYEARETKAPRGYLLNADWSVRFSIQGGDVLDLGNLQDDVERGGVSLGKLDADLNDAYAQGDATLKGAEFEVVTKSDGPVLVGGTWYGTGDVVATLTTGEDGTAGTSADLLPYGTYEISETKAPEGYQLNDEWSTTVEVREDGKVVGLGYAMSDPVVRGGVSVRKVDSERATSDPQGDATLAGAEFQITNDSGHDVVVEGTRHAPGEVVKTIASDEDGVAATASDALPYGSYTIRETKAPEGYLLNGGWSQSFQVRAQGTVIDLTDDAHMVADQVIRGDVALRKVDAELDESLPLGAATLAGAEVTVTNSSAHAVRVGGSEYQPGEVVTTLVTDEAGEASTTGGALPYGTYTLRESKAPTGYLLNKDWFRTIQVREDGSTVDVTDVADALPDQAKRADLRLVKADEDSQGRMANVAFSLTSKTTGESHVLVTDENGMVDTSSSFNTREGGSVNASDAAVSEDGTVDDSKLDATSGVWFSGRTDRETTPTDALGALPYDTYDLRELRCAANEGHRLVSMTVNVTRDGYQLDLGTFDDKEVTVGTTLATPEGAKELQEGTTVALVDEVRYEGLAANADYVIHGELHDMDADGNDLGVVAETDFPLQTEFQADTVSVPFPEVDTTGMAGHRLVATEQVRQGDDVIGSHDDLADEGQSVRVVAIGTTATDAADGDHEVAWGDHATIVDRVEYRGLQAGVEHEVTGTLHLRDADGGDAGPLKDADGNEVTASAAFTPESPDGFVDVTFDFDLSGVSGGSALVAFEEMGRDGLAVATHADIADEGQTVTVSQPPAGEYPNTGQGPGGLLSLGVAAVLVVAGLVLIVVRRRLKARGGTPDPDPQPTQQVAPPRPEDVAPAADEQVTVITDPKVLEAIEAAKRLGYGADDESGR